MLIVVIIDVPSVRFRCNHHGIRDADGWGHPPHQFNLRSRLAWRRSKLNTESNARFWEQIFIELATRSISFKDLRPIWELAHSDGAIPTMVPSADGPLPLMEIYVTADPSVGHDLDDGRIVLLSAAAGSAWTAAGAKTLGSGPSMTFESRLSSPSHLLDLFPELALVQEEPEALRSIPAVWVKGLEENVGPFSRTAVLGMEADGALLIDRDRFDALGWAKGAELLLRCLSRHGVIENGESLEASLSKILDRRSDEARKAVRTEPSLERRLLKAINGEAVPRQRPWHRFEVVI